MDWISSMRMSRDGVQFIQQSEYPYKSQFFKLQMSQSYGHDWLEADVEKVFEYFAEANDGTFQFETFFPNVFGYAQQGSR